MNSEIKDLSELSDEKNNFCYCKIVVNQDMTEGSIEYSQYSF
ncbi:MAG: hypothetical protein PHH22_02745 [Clostridia bacterium]|nr:hypothetical protein [Clostridia bacterium]